MCLQNKIFSFCILSFDKNKTEYVGSYLEL